MKGNLIAKQPYKTSCLYGVQVCAIDVERIGVQVKFVPYVDELDVLLMTKRFKSIVGAERLVIESLISID